MKPSTLVRRSLAYFWPTNLAVIGGVAVAVAVLAGALMVGVSVRASLRDLALQRLGRTDSAIVSPSFFRDALSTSFSPAVPMVAVEGFVSSQETGRRASRVQVYGVDDRFWSFHGVPRPPGFAGSTAFLSQALAAELEARNGHGVILRLKSISDIPVESLHGRKDNAGRSLRLSVGGVLSRENLGEFSISPRQGAILAMFVPLGRLQMLFDQPGRANTMLIAGLDAAAVERRLRGAAQLDDLGVSVRALPVQRAIALESRSTILDDGIATAGERAAERAGLRAVPVLTYLANTIRAGTREIPYSVITATDVQALGISGSPPDRNGIVLNEWAARELGAAVGDPITVEYYLWEPEGRLSTRTADFRLSAVVPVAGAAADPNLVPEYPGITDTERLADWDPPFPVDLRRVRPVDEDYWNRFRATPKAFIPIERGQELWQSRFGRATSLRLLPPSGGTSAPPLDAFERALEAEVDPLNAGLSVYDVRAQALAASTGATDFGEYFTYFSTFLVVSALLLASLFFKFGVEQRLQELGLLQALGVPLRSIRRWFVAEAVLLAVLGGIAGAAGAVAYAGLIMRGLRTWWNDAVGTTSLTLHVDQASIWAGTAAVATIAVMSICWSLRSVAALTPRALLKGDVGELAASSRPNTRRAGPLVAGYAAAVLALALMAGAAFERLPRAAGFFGAGALSLVAVLCIAAWIFRQHRWGAIRAAQPLPMWRMGWRNLGHRPARSVLCIALIAFAAFVIVSVEAFKRGDGETTESRHSSSGGYPLVLETLLPVVHDPNDEAGRDALNLVSESALGDVRFDRFRVKPGDDTSCLNLYQPKNPRVLGATDAFIQSGRFVFQSSLASTPETRANPWLLLNETYPDGAIPVITDANSLTYVLHMKLGDDLVLPGSSERPIRLRLVAALADSLFQGELVMAESQFVRAFPEWEGYRFFLVDTPVPAMGEVQEVLESRLADLGADVVSTRERLAGYHRVEYTYLLTFQLLGGLGLVLGTLGLGAVLLRNVLERRRELALLRALGYRQSDFFAMIVGENVLLLAGGLLAGTLSAGLAIAPAFIDRGGRLPFATVGLLIAGVFATGLLASVCATAAALRSPLLPALKTE